MNREFWNDNGRLQIAMKWFCYYVIRAKLKNKDFLDFEHLDYLLDPSLVLQFTQWLVLEGFKYEVRSKEDIYGNPEDYLHITW